MAKKKTPKPKTIVIDRIDEKLIDKVNEILEFTHAISSRNHNMSQDLNQILDILKPEQKGMKFQLAWFFSGVILTSFVWGLFCLLL